MAGVLIGTVLPTPVAIPVAFASHFAMDIIPHYGVSRDKRDKRFNRLFIQGDSILALAINIPVLVHLAWLPAAYHAWGLQACGWAAASPDFALVYYYFKHGRTLDTYHNGLLKKLHLDFHYERPWLIVPELCITAILAALFYHQLR